MHLFCLCRFPLIFTNIYINLCEKSHFLLLFLKLFVLKTYFKHQFDFFGMSFQMCSIDIDAIENHVHPLHIIVDRNQEFIFLSKPFHIHEQKIS